MGCLRQRAFTLLEICIALFVALALFSLAAGIVRMGMKEGDLPRLRDESAGLIKSARALAMQTGKACELTLDQTRIAYAGKNTGENALPEVGIPEGVRFEVQLWPGDRWIVPERPVAWLFQPSGLCEPYSLRFSQGDSWISFRIHPLTGAIDNESRALQK